MGAQGCGRDALTAETLEELAEELKQRKVRLRSLALCHWEFFAEEKEDLQFAVSEIVEVSSRSWSLDI